MDVAVACIVPDMLSQDVHGVGMGCGFVVGKGMCRVIAAAARVATDEADPEVLGGAADSTFIIWSVAVAGVLSNGVVLCVATDRAAGTTPLFETGTVKDVLTENGEEASCLVHALEADGTRGQLNEGGSRGRMGLGGQGAGERGAVERFERQRQRQRQRAGGLVGQDRSKGIVCEVGI